MRRSIFTQQFIAGIIAAIVVLAGVAIVYHRSTATVPAAAEPPFLDDPSEGPGYDQPDLAAEYFLDQRLPGGREIDLWQRYQDAARRMDAMPRYSTRLDENLPSPREARRAPSPTKGQTLARWTQLGPGNWGGRTRALVINPDNPNVMYAAGVTGGVWKTLDGGQRWRPLADFMFSLRVASLAMDPGDSRVLYAGTGEGVFRSATFHRGAGIYKSTDSGRTWERLDNTLNQDFRYVNDLVVSPLDSSRVYAATRTGVFRSQSGGRTWTQTLVAREERGCLDLALRTDRPTDVLLAACGNFEQASVYRHPEAETDGAWENVLTEVDMGRTTLAIAPSDQDVIYALSASLGVTAETANYEHGLHALFRSDQGGAAGSWTAMVRNTDPVSLDTMLLSRARCQSGSDFVGGQGWYDNVIAVDPADPGIVYAGGIDLYRSDDGGANWGMISHWWDSPPSAHADQHAIVFHPDYDGTSNRTMFVGNDGGIWATQNPRALKATGETAACNSDNTRVAWQSLNNDYAIAQFFHGAAFPDGERYLGGTQDNGTLMGTSKNGVNGWSKVLSGDGGYVAIDHQDPRIYYMETQNLNLFRIIERNGKISRFESAINGIDEDPLNFQFIVPYTIDPTNARRLWIGGKTVWRTINRAGRWRPASTELNAEITALAVAPSNPNRVAVGLTNGRIHRTDEALTANATTEWPFSVPRVGAVISWLAFDPTDDDVLYATSSTFDGEHVFRSTNGGASWTSIDGEGAGRLPNLPVHTVLVDPEDPRRLFIGTDRGVFVSTTRGNRWSVEASGFTNTIVESFSWVDLGRQKGTFLFAFTHGRGAWKVQVRGR